MIEYQHVINSVNAMILIYSWIKLIEKLPIYSARGRVREIWHIHIGRTNMF